jgi:hypothetical protein
VVLGKYYKQIKEIYKQKLWQGSNSKPFVVSEATFSEFLEECEIFGKDYKFADMQIDMRAVQQSSGTKAAKFGNRLVRHGFMEMIVRVSIYKFFRTKKCESVSEALKRLLKKYILPNCGNLNSNKWREDRYINEEVDTIY